MAFRPSSRSRSGLISTEKKFAPTNVGGYETSKPILLALTIAVWVFSASAADNARPSPKIGNFTQCFTPGKIDENIPLLLGNGDIGGLFDPFGGTTYDELRFGSGARRDIRTLLLSQVMVPDYWVLEDQAAHF